MKPPETGGRVLIRAATVADAEHAWTPGVILLDDGHVVAAGAPSEVGAMADVVTIDRPDDAIVPALVNAHAHLDLTHIGPLPPPASFVAWIDVVRDRRATSADEIARSVRQGVELSRRGGTALVGDIGGAGSLVPYRTLWQAGLPGVSYLEVFGMGRGQAAAVQRLHSALADAADDDGPVRLGIQPHAPYSCGLEVYRAAADLDAPMATHLAETLEELTFVRTGEGPMADLLQRLGVWDETIVGLGEHPVDALADVLERRPVLAAHLNYVETAHLERLAGWPVTVAYCPRASAYFGHPHGDHPGHRYREMLDAGINVALGTDSILCLDTPDRISVLDEMRLLLQRDGTAPRRLLAMGTVNGARGLGVASSLVTFDEGPLLGAIAIPGATGSSPLASALRSGRPPIWVAGPFPNTSVEGARV